MKFGNREKIIAVSVVALGLIGALHFVLFAPKARDFQESVQAYNDARRQLESVGQPPPVEEIREFEERTNDYQRRLMAFLRDANLLIPEGFDIPESDEAPALAEGEEEMILEEDMGMGMMGMFGPWAGGGMGMGPGAGQTQAMPEEEFDPLTREQKRVLAGKLRTLEQLRDAGAPTRLSFMDAENQWNILRQLPDAIRRGNVDVADLIRSLEGTDAIIKQAGEGSRLRFQRQSQYVTELRRLGLDQVRRQGLTPSTTRPNTLINSRQTPNIMRDYGNLAAVMYTINRMNLIMGAVPRESLNLASDQEYFDLLEDLLRLDSNVESERESDITYIKWRFAAYDGLKQLEALADLIRMARDTQVFDIASVKFWEPVEVEWVDPAAEPAEDPGMGGMGMMGMDMMMDPSMFMMEPGMGGMDPGMGMDMFGPWGMGGMQPAGPTGEVVGTSTPIELQVRGTNAAVMAFIHQITHSRRLYSVNSLQVTAESGQQNVEVSARIVVHIMSRLQNPRFQLTEAEYERRLEEMERGGGMLAGGDAAAMDPGMGMPQEPGMPSP